MGLQDTVSWYQRKIGTYDKQQWEKTIEQRILTGFKHVLKKTAKLKTDLIDVDLVRGSSFAKAKPKHGLATVTKLAIIRWLLLPFYWAWWVQQTCVATFSLLISLYVLQIFNVALYFYFTNHNGKILERISAYEVIVPAAMMLVLSLVHSEIVATSSWRQTEGCGVKRSRRGKRRFDRGDKSHQHGLVESVTENANFTSRSTAGPSEEVVENQGGDRVQEAGLRRRTVAWRAPLREPAPPVPSTRGADDDGFESLTSHGSSEDVPQLHGQEPAADLNLEPENVARERAWLPAGVGRTSCCSICRKQDSAPFSDTDSELDGAQGSPQRLLQRRRSSKSLQVKTHEHYESSCESEATNSPLEGRERGLNSREAVRRSGMEGQSGSEWLGVTTNSEECSVSSDVDDSSAGDDSTTRQMDDHPFAWEFQMSPSPTAISPSCASSDRVSCMLWEDREVKRADLSVLDISSAIIARVESMPENIDYFYGGVCISVVISLLPSLCRLIEVTDGEAVSDTATVPALEVALESGISSLSRLSQLFDVMFGSTALERIICLSAAVERFSLASLFFFLAAVAERTLKQRFLYAKLFSHLTSFRRARRSQLPHFRLNKVRNIKTWLSVRSYLKKRGPQRSVDVIVSAAFIITLLLLSFLTVELLKDSARLHSEYNLEALVWCLALGVFILRFMTLGNKTNRKYRNLSVLLTEQINLYLQIEQKPNKKEELMVANSVLKLAADLLKELESPYKMSGLSTNPYLYTITKVVILSALSGVLSEMLGFKLKLHNIKISSIK